MAEHLSLFNTSASQGSCIDLIMSSVPIAVRDDLHNFSEAGLLNLSPSLSGFYLGLHIACRLNCKD